MYKSASTQREKQNEQFIIVLYLVFKNGVFYLSNININYRIVS